MEIRSFSEVVITPQKTLILCDIDDTLLKWDRTIESCMDEAISLFPNESEYFQRRVGNDIWVTYLETVSPIWTDKVGFFDMIGKLSPCSRVAFLTARVGGEYFEWTRRDFESLGLTYDPSGVFYTGGKMTKGKYIRNHIPLEGFEYVIFIDDLQDNIHSVSANFPQIQCYRWLQM